MSQDSSLSPAPDSWRLDYNWSKRHLLITPTHTSQPIAQINCHLLSSHLTFLSLPSTTTFGTGSLPLISIHPTFTLNTFHGRLYATSRFATRYQHLSPTFGTPATPMLMSWSTSYNLTDWNFICHDDKMEAVARFATKIWGLKRVGVIEFVGDLDLEKRREVLVTGVVLWWMMIQRMNNPLNLMYSMFGKAGPIRRLEEGGGGEDCHVAMEDGKKDGYISSSRQAARKME